MRYGGSFCPPEDLDNYPCMIEAEDSDKENYLEFGLIERQMEPFRKLMIEQNKALKEIIDEKRADAQKKQEWLDSYRAYNNGNYSEEYLNDCKYWAENFYEKQFRQKDQDCSTGVGCYPEPCICGFKMRKQDPWGKIHNISCDYPFNEEPYETYIPYE